MKQQSSPDRIKMLLRVANFFAAPFGSRNGCSTTSACKDTDYKFNADGAPVPTEQGRSELTAVWRYISSPAYALFDTIRSQEFAQRLVRRRTGDDRRGQFDPTLGLYSASAASSASRRRHV